MKRPARLRKRLTLSLTWLLLIAVSGNSSVAQARQDAKPSGPPRDYSSRHFLVHTDLPAEEANDLLQRLENMLGLISAYWRRSTPSVIECYVVRDLANWPDGTFEQRVYNKIKNGAGVTISQKISNGRRFVAKAVVYATSERNVAQHEAVHAFCHQAFGEIGPVWYSEGMAEMGQYWAKDDLSVNADERAIEYLRSEEPRPVAEIVDDEEKNSRSGDSAENYAWRWALCHVLEVNPNYRRKFRQLGLSYLNGRQVAFETIYRREAQQLDFEYRFFLEHLEAGLRADLCAWDWSKPFRPLSGRRATAAKIEAARGWQPSQVEVKAGQAYAVTAEGEWRLSADDDSLTADGGSNGNGKLLGVILTSDFTLGEPFEIGADGTFTPEVDGMLYFRCGEDWTEIADNDGTVNVKTTLAGEGNDKGLRSRE